MKTITDLITEIAKPSPGASLVGVSMLLLAVHMIYRGEYN